MPPLAAQSGTTRQTSCKSDPSELKRTRTKSSLQGGDNGGEGGGGGGDEGEGGDDGNGEGGGGGGDGKGGSDGEGEGGDDGKGGSDGDGEGEGGTSTSPRIRPVVTEVCVTCVDSCRRRPAAFSVVSVRVCTEWGKSMEDAFCIETGVT